MSKTVKLAGALPSGVEVNGVDQTASDLLEDPERLRCALVWYDVQKIEESFSHGRIQVPTIQVKRFEPLGGAKEVVGAIKEAVTDAIRKRTGRTPIPWDIVEVSEGHDPDQRTIDDEDDDE